MNESPEARLNDGDRLRLAAYEPHVEAVRDGLFPPPRHLVLFPTYRCDHSCPGCLYRDSRVGGGEWSESLTKRVLELVAKLQPHHVELSGGGEPTRHPQFQDLVRGLSSHVGTLGLITNGQSVTDDDIEAIVASCHHVRVSLDAVEPEAYHRTRGANANLHRTLSNLKALSDRRGEGRLRSVGAKFLLSLLNLDALEPILAWAQTSDLDLVQFKSIRDDPLEPDQKALAMLSERIEEAARKGDSRTRLVCDLLPMPPGRGPCWLSAFHAVIDPRGWVFMCCYYPGREDSLRLGSLRHSEWNQIWGAPDHLRKIGESEIAKCRHDCRFKLYGAVFAARAGGAG
jgi:MoaA/NifB/PqqE/SkfB family radical SAM enzyme